MGIKILVIDDEKEIGYTISRVLRKEQYQVECLQNLALIDCNPPVWEGTDIVFLDINMPDYNGLDVLEKIKSFSSEILVVIMTAFGSEEIAVRAMKSGADDYLKKPFDIEHLRNLCKNLSCRISRGVDCSLDNLSSRIISNSPQIQNALRLIQKIRDIDVTVLISGESGTGKELFAQTLHSAGKFASEPFIPLNCGAIPENLVESELFGFEKGSFTGAYSTQHGKFELAGKGTIFLDEIGELPLSLQSKLLRVLQEKNFLRIGGKDLIPVQCRIVTATHQDLESEVRNGKFREDLFYRLNVVRIDLPSLRERKEDIASLSKGILEDFNSKYGLSWSGFSEEALNFLKNYSFPGNIRELKNIVERIMVTGEGNVITLTHLKTIYHFPDSLLRNEELSDKDYLTLKKELILKFDREYFTRLLDNCQGNISRVSRLSGLQRKSIYEKLKELGLSEGMED